MADEFTNRIYNRLPSTRYSLLYEYYTYLQWTVEKGATVLVCRRCSILCLRELHVHVHVSQLCIRNNSLFYNYYVTMLHANNVV